MQDYWDLYIFKRGFKYYLVPSDSLDNAWTKLGKKQSMSIERCQKEYLLLDTIGSHSEVRKL